LLWDVFGGPWVEVFTGPPIRANELASALEGEKIPSRTASAGQGANVKVTVRRNDVARAREVIGSL
jgi:hypothetical protein